MNSALPRFLWAFALSVSIISNVFPRDAHSSLEKGKQAYLRKDYRQAEKHFRAVTKAKPDFWFGHLFLGHSLFHSEKYEQAIPEYEKARELGLKSGEIEQLDERVIIDQLGMSYADSGQLERAKELFEGAIKRDPDYPMYYYILGCVFAEQGDLDEAIGRLKLGFERRTNMLPGEPYPNPRTDDSFTKFLGNEKFEAALKEMGF